MIRIVIATIGLAAGGVLTFGATYPESPTNQQKIPVPVVPQLLPRDVDPTMPYFRVCAQACDDCARSCEICADHCAKMIADGRKEQLPTLRLCNDCAAFCQAASRIIASDGPMSDLIAASCAEACKRCGDACEKHSGDPIMKKCTEECRKCEKACLQMKKQAETRTPPK